MNAQSGGLQRLRIRVDCDERLWSVGFSKSQQQLARRFGEGIVKQIKSPNRSSCVNAYKYHDPFQGPVQDLRKQETTFNEVFLNSHVGCPCL